MRGVTSRTVAAQWAPLLYAAASLPARSHLAQLCPRTRKAPSGWTGPSAWWVRQYGGVISSYRSGDRVYGRRVDYPIATNSSVPMSSAKTVWVETYNLRSDARTYVMICGAHWAGSDEWCSPEQTQSGSGHKSYAFGDYQDRWDDMNDFPYYTVYSYNTNNSVAENVRVNGIFITN